MTDRIGIDEQIASLQAKMTTGDRPLEAAIQTLIDYKRIKEAKVPEPAAWGYRKYDAAYDEVTYHFSDNSDEVAKHDQFPTPLYGPEVLDLLRRETAKNERVKELLREPSVEMILAAMGVHRRWENADGDFSQGYWQAIHAAMSAALLAEVEKEMNDANR